MSDLGQWSGSGAGSGIPDMGEEVLEEATVPGLCRESAMVSLFALLSSFIHWTLLLSCRVPGPVLNAGHSERIVLLGCSPGVQTHSAYVLCWKWRPRAWETPRGEGLSRKGIIIVVETGNSFFLV